MSINQRRKGGKNSKNKISIEWIPQWERRKTFHRLFIFIGSRRKAVMVIWICEIEKEVFRGKTWKIGEGGIIGEKLFNAKSKVCQGGGEKVIIYGGSILLVVVFLSWWSNFRLINSFWVEKSGSFQVFWKILIPVLIKIQALNCLITI